MSQKVDAERRRESEANRMAKAQARLEEMRRILSLWEGRVDTVTLARRLGISKGTLYSRLRMLGLVDDKNEDAHGC